MSTGHPIHPSWCSVYRPGTGANTFQVVLLRDHTAHAQPLVPHTAHVKHCCAETGTERSQAWWSAAGAHLQTVLQQCKMALVHTIHILHAQQPLGACADAHDLRAVSLPQVAERAREGGARLCLCHISYFAVLTGTKHAVCSMDTAWPLGMC